MGWLRLIVQYIYVYIYMCIYIYMYIYWLVVWNMNFILPYIGNVIIPTDELIFFRGVETTGQNWLWHFFSREIVELDDGI